MRLCFYKKKSQQGFTLIELVIASAVFAVIAVSVYQGYAILLKLVSASRVKVTAADLLNEQFEIIRNLPYSEVGIQGGLPSGVLLHTQTIIRDSDTYVVTTTVRNIDDPYDGLFPVDLSPDDYKLVDLDINCASCMNFTPVSVTTRVAPKNLETAASNGALFIKVFDGNGQPVTNANVHVVDSKATTTITIDDVTDNNGMLQIVDAPPGVNAYHVVVTKPGYTTDQTYATSTTNPNPTKPDATVVLQQVTQVSFTIDKVSTINLSTITDTCNPIPNVPISMAGSKLIGTNPNVYKYYQSFSTGSNGTISLPNMEWDTYNLIINGGSYYLAGVSPLLPAQVLPNATQNIQLVLSSQSPSLLLVTVKDNSTQLPISGATVTLSGGSYNTTLTTGLGFLGQTDWSGGPGQTDFSNPTQYSSSNGNIDTGSPAGEMKLSNVLGTYSTIGSLTSSVFDTGTSSNFSQISWNPLSEPPATGANSVQFQIATAGSDTSSTTWTFLGPDGTSGTYYNTSNTNINAVNNGNRYFRYQASLQTASTTFTPDVSDVSLTFTSGCIPPGQVLFGSIPVGTYTLTVDKSGYSEYQGQVTIPANSWGQQGILMVP